MESVRVFFCGSNEVFSGAYILWSANFRFYRCFLWLPLGRWFGNPKFGGMNSGGRGEDSRKILLMLQKSGEKPVEVGSFSYYLEGFYTSTVAVMIRYDGKYRLTIVVKYPGKSSWRIKRTVPWNCWWNNRPLPKTLLFTVQNHSIHTIPETNISPENWWLEYCFFLGGGWPIFRAFCC